MPNKGITSAGQHHIPIRAGIEHSRVNVAMKGATNLWKGCASRSFMSSSSATLFCLLSNGVSSIKGCCQTPSLHNIATFGCHRPQPCPEQTSFTSHFHDSIEREQSAEEDDSMPWVLLLLLAALADMVSLLLPTVDVMFCLTVVV